jgi:hypothetical protein
MSTKASTVIESTAARHQNAASSDQARWRGSARRNGVNVDSGDEPFATLDAIAVTSQDAPDDRKSRRAVLIEETVWH